MRFFIATKNAKKLAELERILKPLNIEVFSESLLERDLPEVEETGKTFAENALLKARHGCKFTGFPTIADDSGLCVYALGGAPGVYSARYAGENCNDEANMQKLLTEMSDLKGDERNAEFVSVIACVFPDGREFTVEGKCKGSIAAEKHGNGGFGYDPLFATEYGNFGEMTAEEKDAVSHRGNALKLLAEKLKSYI